MSENKETKAELNQKVNNEKKPDKKDKSKNLILVICCVVIVAIILSIVVFSKKGNDYENVKTTVVTEQTTKTVNVTTTQADNSGDIKIINSDNIKLPKNLDAEYFAKIAYEMKSIFVFEPFKNISDVSQNKIVQFAFSHKFYKSLTDMPKSSKMVYRTASKKDIKKQLLTFFGSDKVDITKSDLYNARDNKLEMWQLNYTANLYINCYVAKKGNGFELKCDIFDEKEKSTLKSTATILLKKQKKNYIISEFN